MVTTTSKSAGAVLATTAAMLFAFAPVASTHAEEAQVQCTGINACKGQGACATANNSCKGQNACKGQGFVMASARECADQGGTVMEMQ